MCVVVEHSLLSIPSGVLETRPEFSISKKIATTMTKRTGTSLWLEKKGLFCAETYGECMLSLFLEHLFLNIVKGYHLQSYWTKTNCWNCG
jgi:hypothetical protein